MISIQVAVYYNLDSTRNRGAHFLERYNWCFGFVATCGSGGFSEAEADVNDLKGKASPGHSWSSTLLRLP